MAVPGALKGYWEAHQRYGKLPWSSLFEPSIKLCEDGFIVTRDLAIVVNGEIVRITEEPTLAEYLINPITELPWQVSILLNKTCIIFCCTLKN